ncbi:MAG TPA: tocopherol cyclase family protein [Capillimicrobium sp.]|nr:tocopherol cyclase family protein [Capillimicrobium sp.]
MLHRFRATGADLPFADLRRAHGVAMEGFFWRLTDAAAGRAVIVLCGVNRDRLGHPWALVGLAAHPGGFVRHAVLPVAHAGLRRYAVSAGDALRADAHGLDVDLGPDARLRVRFDGVRGWPSTRAYGGLGIAHALPGLDQYWHPHALGGRATGHAVLGGERVGLRGARLYAEKNWSPVGFPSRWWWGHAADFEDEDLCVAFAGGAVGLGPGRLTATAVVVRAGGRVLRLGNPVTSPVTAEVRDGVWRVRGRAARYAVELEGEADPGLAHVLPVPLPAERRAVPGSLQHLGGRLRLSVRRHGRRWLEAESALAGLEQGGREHAAAELERRAAATPLAA